MKKTVVLTLAAAMLSSALLVSFAHAKVDAKKLFESKCSYCHSLDRPREQSMTPAQWKMTVDRMIDENGAPIAPDERKIILNYLIKNFGPK